MNCIENQKINQVTEKTLSSVSTLRSVHISLVLWMIVVVCFKNHSLYPNLGMDLSPSIKNIKGHEGS